MSSFSSRNGSTWLNIPGPGVSEHLPAQVKAAIQESVEAGAKMSEASAIAADENAVLREAAAKDVQLRADAIAAGKPDPGSKHYEAAMRRVNAARQQLPVLSELHVRAIRRIQTVAQECGDESLKQLADQVYANRRGFIQATELAEAKKTTELETQAALVWLSALIADKEIHKRGLVNLGDVVGVFDRLRTVLTKVSEESVFYSWEARRDRSRSNGNHPEVDNQEGELLSERTSS